MRRALLALLVVCSAFAVRADALPEGWLTAVDSNAAARVAKDFGNNVLRCMWAGDKPKVAAALPANVSFQLAVAGKEEYVTNVQAILDASHESAARRPALPSARADAAMDGPLDPVRQARSVGLPAAGDSSRGV